MTKPHGQGTAPAPATQNTRQPDWGPFRQGGPAIPAWINRAGRIAFWILVGLYFAFAALVLALRYLVLPHIDDYREDIVHIASQALGLKVAIGDVEASWHGWLPQLVLSD